MNLQLEKLHYHFSKKPLVVGGKAMEYYNLRKAGNDIDLIAHEGDIIALIRQYPSRVKYLWGDLGVCPFEFEIWRTIHLFDYGYLRKDAIELEDSLIISIENLLFMKALAIQHEKYRKDTELIGQEVLKIKYATYDTTIAYINKLLVGIEKITYLEKTGPSRVDR